LLFCFALASGAHADPVIDSAAEALFEEGRRLLEAGRFVEACPRFAESQRLDPAAGTLLNLALCDEKFGRTASAWLKYKEALSLAAREGNLERQAIARDRISEIQPHLTRLQIEPPLDRPVGFWIAIDGIRVDVSLSGSGIPMDPGTYRLSAGAPGRRSIVFPVQVDSSRRVLAVRLPKLPVLKSTRSSTVPTRERAPSSSARASIMGVSLGLGAAGLLAATYFGVRAWGDWRERNARCRAECDRTAVVLGEGARSSATAANVSLGIAVLALGIGGYLFIEPIASAQPTRTRASIQGATIAARGSL
jgi:hypothetical protein